MAASCMGAFGSYKLQYSRYLKDRLQQERLNQLPTETVWITKRYAPTDERVTAPVPRHKHVVSKHLARLNAGEGHWIPVSDPPLISFDRSQRRPGEVIYVSHQGSRCEDWSTLRQMLPSYSNIKRVDQPDWGVRLGPPPIPCATMPTRLPHVNSCMTKFVDSMHQSNRQFKLC